MSFVQKYKPRNLGEVVGQREAVEVFLKWIKSWKPGSKALLLHGMPGVGKTALINAWASDGKYEFIEMNASDFRSAQQIQGVLGQSMKQQPLFKKSKIFLIDEVDGIAGREDMGGVAEIIKIIKETRFPVVLTANNPWDQKLRAVRAHCELVGFGKIRVWDIEKKLQQICDMEKINIDKQVLRQLASRASGDLRSAMNDLETVSQGKREIAAEDLVALGYRERGANIFDVVKNIFKAESAKEARAAINGSDKNPEEIFWWIENNIVSEYEDPEEVAKAYDALSMADIFRRRISSRQNWRYLAYMIDEMTAGVAGAKKKVYNKFTRYQYPQNIILLARTKATRNEKKEVYSKVAAVLHCSTRKFKEDYLSWLRVILKDKNFKKNFTESFDFSKEEVSLLLK